MSLHLLFIHFIDFNAIKSGQQKISGGGGGGLGGGGLMGGVLD